MYEDQLGRVKRWYARFTKINRSVPHHRPHEELTDEVYAFFVNCYHLKDWIKSDPSLTFSSKHAAVERFITCSKYMSICADLCNGLKHLKLNQPLRSGKQPQVATGHIGLSMGRATTTIKMKYTIDTARGQMDAFQLATKCMRAWRRFIKKNIKPAP